MIEQLRQQLLVLQRAPGLQGGLQGRPGTLSFGIAALDSVLGGGLMRGALHEIAAAGEPHLAAATGFALGLAALGVTLSGRRKSLFWVAEDMALAESGAPHGAGLDTFGLAPERLVTVKAAHRRDLFWAMEEALRCHAVDTVIGEMRAGGIDGVAIRRLSLAAAENGALALLLRSAPPTDSSTAATRWIVGGAPSFVIPGREQKPRFAAQLVRNRRGPAGSWILEWSDSDERFILAAHSQPVAAPVFDRSHHQAAGKVA